MRASAFPRILFVTPAAFNHFTGGGVTFSNLFSGWPKDRIATVHNDAVPTSTDVCERYFVLGRSEIDLFAPLRIARTMRDRGSNSNNGAGVGPITRPGLIARIQGDAAPQRARLSGALERWIAEFEPELIYTILGSNAVMELIGAIRRRFALPLVVHMMDDFPNVAYRRGLFAPLERVRMQRLLADNFRAAAVCMGICTEMCIAFSRRYRRPFLPFQNCVDVERWRPVLRSSSGAARQPYRLLYFGSVFGNAQLASILDICRSVARLNDQGFAVTFDIASPTLHLAANKEALAIHPSIRLVTPTEDDRAFFEQLAAADVLVLPVNYDGETIEFIRYSMPTKVPAYMASGTPILVYGPHGVAQVDYAEREAWGHVVSDRAPGALDAGLRRILSDSALRESLRVRAQALAVANHDSTKVRTQFQSTLKAAARGLAVTAPLTAISHA
jgi:glycosyltransferase involved in cell wall biosynthesis